MCLSPIHCRLFRFVAALVAVLATSLFAPDAHARLYRCLDDRGQWTFQDRPCPKGTERKEVRERNLAPTELRPRKQREIPTACLVESAAFRFEHEDLMGIEAKLVMNRDQSTYQLAIQIKGEWLDAELVPKQVSLVQDLGRQGLVVGEGGLANPDWMTNLRVLGYGHSRTRGLVDSAKTALDLHVVIHIRGREEPDWSLPIPAGILETLRNEALACKKDTE
ncbi:MAG: DUF4124 domain-containing protein [Ahniella sp.]|nr:DUF4124 domain-containing protein [Ahniella sp.]